MLSSKSLDKVDKVIIWMNLVQQLGDFIKFLYAI